MGVQPTLVVRDLTVEFRAAGGWMRGGGEVVRAVDRVSIDVHPGEILSIVGESGSGKTTLARALLGLQRETSGEVHLEGKHVSGLSPRQARKARQSIQYVHQDAGAALDPWWSIGRSLNEALVISGISDAAERKQRMLSMISAVGLNESFLPRYPHELSGGQQRRVSLARILLMESKILILDEPTAGLDVSIQSTILQLLLQLRKDFQLTYIFISHDLSVVRLISDRVAIMLAGRIVETGVAKNIFVSPQHEYTRKLLDAAPRLTSAKRRAQQSIA